ncbi:MAG: c-type cytochrome [Burkholderiales bacterium]
MPRISRPGRILGLALVAFAPCLSPSSHASDEAIAPALAMVQEKYGIDMKKLFSTKCSWCHQGMGMKQADGPKLAGTEKTKQQVMTQISKGKSPMPGFKNQLTEKELEALADYIKALPK